MPSAVDQMLEGAVRERAGERSYTTLNVEHTFILLLTNTFENSESFFSNTYDFGAVLRDYVDLRFFFDKYKGTLDWTGVENSIEGFGIHDIAETVMGNLRKVYGRDVTFGCLPSVKPAESEWGLGILERMRDADLCRGITIKAMRKRWLAEGSHSVCPVSEIRAGDAPEICLDDFKCASPSNALFNIAYTRDSFVLTWALPPIFYERKVSYLCQFKFFPLTDALAYTSYMVNFCSYNGVYKAYGRSTMRHRQGAVSAEAGTLLLVSRFSCGDKRILRTSLPFAELGMKDIPENGSLCVAAEIYKNHYGNIYHKLDAAHSGPAVSLIEMKRNEVNA
jgi:hypothetical protein